MKEGGRESEKDGRSRIDGFVEEQKTLTVGRIAVRQTGERTKQQPGGREWMEENKRKEERGGKRGREGD